MIIMNFIKLAMLHNWVNNNVARCNRARSNANCNRQKAKKQKVEYCDWHTNRFFNFVARIFSFVSFTNLYKFIKRTVL